MNSDPQLTALPASRAARLFWASFLTMLGFQLFLALLFGNGACKINLRDIVDEFKVILHYCNCVHLVLIVKGEKDGRIILLLLFDEHELMEKMRTK